MNPIKLTSADNYTRNTNPTYFIDSRDLETSGLALKIIKGIGFFFATILSGFTFLIYAAYKYYSTEEKQKALKADPILPDLADINNILIMRTYEQNDDIDNAEELTVDPSELTEEELILSKQELIIEKLALASDPSSKKTKESDDLHAATIDQTPLDDKEWMKGVYIEDVDIEDVLPLKTSAQMQFILTNNIIL